MADLPGDPNDFLDAMIKPADLNPTFAPGLKSRQFMHTALSKFPPVRFDPPPGATHQRYHVEEWHDQDLDTPAIKSMFGEAETAQLDEDSAQRRADEARGVPYDLKNIGAVHIRGMQLCGAQTAGVRARIEYVSGTAAGAVATTLDPKVHGPPPTVKLPTPLAC
jgi:hypothetical protein